MKITFIGATHEVTGSCYYLEAAGKKFLVDCGIRFCAFNTCTHGPFRKSSCYLRKRL